MVSQQYMILFALVIVAALLAYRRWSSTPPLTHDYELVGAGPGGPWFSDPALCTSCDPGKPQRWYYAEGEDKARADAGDVMYATGYRGPASTLAECKRSCDTDPTCKAFNYYRNPYNNAGERVDDGVPLCWKLDSTRVGETRLKGNEMWKKVM